jgi:hypothetical protein
MKKSQSITRKLQQYAMALKELLVQVDGRLAICAPSRLFASIHGEKAHQPQILTFPLIFHFPVFELGQPANKNAAFRCYHRLASRAWGPCRQPD